MQNLYYPELDKLWNVCEELELPIHRHVQFPTENADVAGPAAPWIGSLEVPFFELRAIAHLKSRSGVFERFPNLKFVATELSKASGLPAYLANLDASFDSKAAKWRPNMVDGDQSTHWKPSEYFETNCYVAGPLDLKSAIKAGAPNIMFGLSASFRRYNSVYAGGIAIVPGWATGDSSTSDSQ